MANNKVSTRVGVSGQDKISLLLIEQVMGMAKELDLQNEMPAPAKKGSKLQARQWRVASWGLFEGARYVLFIKPLGEMLK